MHKIQEIPQKKGFAAIVFPKGPDGKTVIVRNPEKRDPKWKMPGGAGEVAETPAACAVRELRGETGLTVKESQLTLVEKIDRGTHDLYFFTATANNFGGFRERGDEGEEIVITYANRIVEMQDFLPFHRALLAKHGLIDEEC